MDFEGAFLDLEGTLLHSLPKSGGAMTPLAPPVPTSSELFQEDLVGILLNSDKVQVIFSNQKFEIILDDNIKPALLGLRWKEAFHFE